MSPYTLFILFLATLCSPADAYSHKKYAESQQQRIVLRMFSRYLNEPLGSKKIVNTVQDMIYPRYQKLSPVDQAFIRDKAEFLCDTISWKQAQCQDHEKLVDATINAANWSKKTHCYEPLWSKARELAKAHQKLYEFAFSDLHKSLLIEIIADYFVYSSVISEKCSPVEHLNLFIGYAITNMYKNPIALDFFPLVQQHILSFGIDARTTLSLTDVALCLAHKLFGQSNIQNALCDNRLKAHALLAPFDHAEYLLMLRTWADHTSKNPDFFCISCEKEIFNNILNQQKIDKLRHHYQTLMYSQKTLNKKYCLFLHPNSQ